MGADTSPEDPDARPDQRATSVTAALRTRRSVRAFLPTPVPREVVEQLLAAAALAGSNSNTQPWHVHVVTGGTKRRLTEDLWRSLDDGDRQEQPGYRYQPGPEQWVEPHRARRREFGDRLYRRTLGVDDTDGVGRDRHHRRNYEFFGAPVGIVLTTSSLPLDGALLDAGLFLQSFMLLAREAGLHTCAQASFIDFHHVLRRHLPIPDTDVVICGLALGHADPEHPLDALRTPREPVTSFAEFHD